MGPLWARLLSLLVVIALVLPSSTNARACAVTCCRDADGDLPVELAVTRAPCCTGGADAARISPILLGDMYAPPIIALLHHFDQVALVSAPVAASVSASYRASGPPRRGSLYRRHCSYLL